MNEDVRNAETRPSRWTALSDRSFLRRLLLILLIAAAAFVAWRLSEVLVLAFGAALLALLLRGLAGVLSRGTHLPEAWAVAPVVLALLALVGAAGWLFGSQIAGQFNLLAQDLPQNVARFIRDLRTTPWGGWFLGLAQDLDLTSATGQVAGRVAGFFGSAFRAIAYLAVLLFAAIYFAAQPERYRYGLLRLIPPERRERMAEVLDLTGATLRRWLVGQAITMTVVGVLTGVGLWALGVGAPLALGLISGMFAFIPYVGPLLAAAPGLLMAAAQGPKEVLYAAVLYAGVHFVEGNLVTPLVQAEAVELPPVLTIFATLVFGLLLGPIGVLLAAPLTVVLLVTINTLYLEDVLGEPRAWPPLRRGGGRG
jgi:predicted PurR-regulated permease PerM